MTTDLLYCITTPTKKHKYVKCNGIGEVYLPADRSPKALLKVDGNAGMYIISPIVENKIGIKNVIRYTPDIRALTPLGCMMYLLNIDSLPPACHHISFGALQSGHGTRVQGKFIGYAFEQNEFPTKIDCTYAYIVHAVYELSDGKYMATQSKLIKIFHKRYNLYQKKELLYCTVVEPPSMPLVGVRGRLFGEPITEEDTLLFDIKRNTYVITSKNTAFGKKTHIKLFDVSTYTWINTNAILTPHSALDFW